MYLFSESITQLHSTIQIKVNLQAFYHFVRFPHKQRSSDCQENLSEVGCAVLDSRRQPQREQQFRYMALALEYSENVFIHVGDNDGQG